MKRQVILFVFLAGFSANALKAQDSPASLAERQEAEERYKRITADIEDLKTTMLSYQQRLNEQREEIRKLNEELARANSNKDLATRDDLKHLVDKIKEVDEKRLADAANVMGQFEKLQKLLAPPGTPKANPPAPAPSGKPPVEPKSGNEKGYEYIIRSGDNPRVISAGLAKQGVKVSPQQIIDANPAIKDWAKLRIGQKIFIPSHGGVGQP